MEARIKNNKINTMKLYHFVAIISSGFGLHFYLWVTGVIGNTQLAGDSSIA